MPFCNALIVRRLCGGCECLLASAFCRQFLCPLPCARHAAGILLFVVVLGCFCRVAAVAFSSRMSPRWFCWFHVFVRNVSVCSVCQRPLLLSVRSSERYVRWVLHRTGLLVHFRQKMPVWELNLRKMKKVREKFGGKKKTPYLCTRLQEQGRLAQLV